MNVNGVNGSNAPGMIAASTNAPTAADTADTTGTADTTAGSDTPTTVAPRALNGLRLEKHHGPHKFFKPTHLHFIDDDGNKVEWQSRKARKGRYPPREHLLLHPNGETESVRMRMAKMEESLKPHLKSDVSFWVAFSFLLGSAIWVINGLIAFLPLIRDVPNQYTLSLVAAATAFVGGVIFVVGSYLMVVEALNRGRETNMGTSLYRLFARLRDKVEVDVEGSNAPDHSAAEAAKGNDWPAEKKGFVWWGKPLWHDMGYVAAYVQLWAAIIFWIATLTGLPHVLPGLKDGTQIALVDVFNWTPQVIGGCLFIVSSTILMLEVHHKWWLPRPMDIGWQVAFWNLIGSWGFMICGALGYSHDSGVAYQATLSSFWGSCAFFIGGGFQFWEVIWRTP